MRFESDKQRRAAFAQMRAGRKTSPAGPRRALKKLSTRVPLMSLPEIKRQIALYEGRPVPTRLVQQLSRHGTEALKVAGYTSGLEPLRLPGLNKKLVKGQAWEAMQGKISPILSKAHPLQGVQLRPEVAAEQARSRRQAIQTAALLSGLAAVPAGYLFLRTARGQRVLAQAVRGFHPLRPIRKFMNDTKFILAHRVGERVRTVDASLRQKTNLGVDAFFDKLIGVGEVPGWIDKLDAKAKIPLYALARKAKVPFLDMTLRAGPAIRQSQNIWKDMLRLGKASGRMRVPVSYNENFMPTYGIGMYDLKRVGPEVIRRRKIR